MAAGPYRRFIVQSERGWTDNKQTIGSDDVINQYITSSETDECAVHSEVILLTEQMQKFTAIV